MIQDILEGQIIYYKKERNLKAEPKLGTGIVTTNVVDLDPHGSGIFTRIRN